MDSTEPKYSEVSLLVLGEKFRIKANPFECISRMIENIHSNCINIRQGIFLGKTRTAQNVKF